MGTVPANYTWIDDERPDFRQMEARLTSVVSFLMNPPMVRLRKTVVQSIPNAAGTALSWDFVEVETVNMWDAAQPTRITPSVPGWYLGSGGGSFDPNTTGYREFEIKKNGAATERVLRVKTDAWTSASQTAVCRGNLFLEQFNGTTDYIEVTAFQNTGGALNINVSAQEQQPEVSLRWFAAL